MSKVEVTTLSKDLAKEPSSDMVKGAGATLLTVGAAAFVNYGISFVLDYADRRIDDPGVSLPLLGSVMIMAVGKRLMDFAEQRGLHTRINYSEGREFDPNTPRSQTPYDITVFNDRSVMDLRPIQRRSDPQEDPRNF